MHWCTDFPPIAAGSGNFATAAWVWLTAPLRSSAGWPHKPSRVEQGTLMSKFAVACATLLLGLAGGASADEASIRKNIAERLPNFPAIDEVTKTAIPGIYELP